MLNSAEHENLFSKKEFAVVSNLRYYRKNAMLSWIEHEKKLWPRGLIWSAELKRLMWLFSGVTVCVVAVGSKVNVTEINAIATPSCVFYLESFSAYHSVMESVYRQKEWNFTTIKHYHKEDPVSILRKSISGRHRPVRVADGPMTARCRFT